MYSALSKNTIQIIMMNPPISPDHSSNAFDSLVPFSVHASKQPGTAKPPASQPARKVSSTGAAAGLKRQLSS